jgi:hypothetical protein
MPSSASLVLGQALLGKRADAFFEVSAPTFIGDDPFRGSDGCAHG